MELKLINLPCTLSELQSAIQSYCNCFSNWNVTLRSVRGKYIAIDVPHPEKGKVCNSTKDVTAIALESSNMLMSVAYRLLRVGDELRELNVIDGKSVVSKSKLFWQSTFLKLPDMAGGEFGIICGPSKRER